MELLHSEILFGDKSGTTNCEVILRNNNKIIYYIFKEIRSINITEYRHSDYLKNIIPTYYFNDKILDDEREVILIRDKNKYISGNGTLVNISPILNNEMIVTSLGEIMLDNKLYYLIYTEEEYYIVPDDRITTNTYTDNINLIDKL